MNTNRIAFPRRAAVWLTAALIATSLDFSSVGARATTDGPFHPNSPTPNAGVAPGHRASGDFTARRPGNLPPYGPRTHAYTGVTHKTP